ncbi:MAG: xylulokinase [Bacteroidota bacterium]
MESGVAMPHLLLGIDVGTTGSKALLVDENGTVRASATHEYPMYSPRPLWAEQTPGDWWDATVLSIRDILSAGGIKPGEIAAIGLTGQMHGMVLTDARGSVLRPCIMWNDQRTGAECSEITRRVGEARVLELTGNPILPGFTAPKIEWVRKNEPQIYRKVAKVLLPKDFVRFRLTGAFATDVADASGTSLFNVGKRAWSNEMLEALDIPPGWMADVTESEVLSGKVDARAAAATGLSEGTPVVAGAGDQAAQAVGTGIVQEGVISVTLGTSGVVFVTSNSYRVEPEGRLHAFCHAVPGKWHLMGVMLSAGGSLRWFRDALGDTEIGIANRDGRDPYELLSEGAARVPAGSEGLLFLPYLTGERTPYPNPNARAVFFGLTVRHTRRHMTRAVLEGVTFGLRDSLELAKELGVEAREIRASGGGARSALWRQIMADIFGTEITTVNVTEGAAYGAALLAGVGSNVFGSVDEACKRVVTTTGSIRPGASQGIYDSYYKRYRALYRALEGEFDAIARVTAAHPE